ncbi:hypothetical protein [Nocardioides sp. SYSU D00065]|uniref:hypothetical protein n=1 Tax=Nocardioides sp. SYSU D00065 TaxID=2817378 RepID=UPI001B31E0F6|nr:hypothetical protein [Nocardioides sp. SYSU D00065]
MTTTQRAGRAPALALTVTILTIVAAFLALSTTGSSKAVTSPSPASGAADATVPSISATPTNAASGGADSRSEDSAGQMYLDDTEARRGEMAHAYNTCLLDNGAARDNAAEMAVFQGDHNPVVIAEPVPSEALSACADLEMKQPRELDPATNPDYHAEAQANVDCLREHGIAVHLPTTGDDVPSGLLWTYDSASTPVPDDAAQIEATCLMSTFGR